MYSEKGYVWQYISNDRIKLHKLEKIINKNLHLDSPAEKGRRLQAMIDKAQDEHIDHNKNDIARNKKEIEDIKRGRK